MNYFLDKMKENLSENDKNLLLDIYEPTVVAVSPVDAWNFIRVMPDGEIRAYGCIYNDKLTKPVDNKGRKVYLSSRDCGLSWKTIPITDKNVLETGDFDPENKRFVECTRVKIVKKEEIDSPLCPLSGRFLDEEYLKTLENPSKYENMPREGFFALVGGKENFDKIENVSFIDPSGVPPLGMLFLKHRKRTVIATYTGKFVYDDTDVVYETSLVVFYSDDDCETWNKVELESLGRYEPKEWDEGERWQNYSIEPTIEELEDGTLMMIVRTTHDYHYAYYSYDAGETWTKPIKTPFHSVNTTPRLYKLSDGRMLFFWTNNEPLPEPDKTKLFPPLGLWEQKGAIEDYFTNRDANFIAISEDDGKTWKTSRELYLNDVRNYADFRSVGGIASSIDKSVHQAQIVELPFNKILIQFGQNEASGRIVIFDLDWLYEKSREEDFRIGLKNVSTHMYIKSVGAGFHHFSGHCAYNRTNGALLVPDPEGNFEEALCIGRVYDPRLLFEKQGMVWNFPSSDKGKVKIKLRVMYSGVKISLSDHWINPCDERVDKLSHLSFNVESDIAPDDRWTDITIKYDVNAKKANVFADEKLILEKEIEKEAPLGLSYLHIQTLAEYPDFEGTLIKYLKKD